MPRPNVVIMVAMDLNIGYLAAVLVAVLLSMTLHEAMHAYAGYALGDDTARLEGRLTLNPISHIDPFATILLPLMLAAIGAPPFGAAKPVPFNPNNVRFGEFGAAMVGLAGPFTNLLLALVSFLIFTLGGLGNTTAGFFLEVFTLVNLAFFVFNMIPLPPLDGSRALYAVAPDGVRRVMEQMEQFGIIVVFAIVLLFNAQLGAFMSGAIGSILSLFTALIGR